MFRISEFCKVNEAGLGGSFKGSILVNSGLGGETKGIGFGGRVLSDLALADRILEVEVRWKTFLPVSNRDILGCFLLGFSATVGVFKCLFCITTIAIP